MPLPCFSLKIRHNQWLSLLYHVHNIIFYCYSSIMPPVKINLDGYPESLILRLIGEIQKHPLLHDIKVHERSSLDHIKVRDDTWNSIGAICGITGEESLAIWRILRRKFTLSFKAYKKSGDKNCNPNNWVYFDSLLFLIPYIHCGEEVCTSPTNGVETGGAASSLETLSSHHNSTSIIAKKSLQRSKNLLLSSQKPIMKQLCRTPRGKRMPFDTEKLISIVRSYPIIYQTRGKKSRFHQTERSTTWQLISKEMDAPPEVCAAKWASLWKNMAKYSLTGNWIWYSQMKDFLPFLEHRATRKLHNSDADTKQLDSSSSQISDMSSVQQADTSLPSEPLNGFMALDQSLSSHHPKSMIPVSYHTL